MTADDCVGLLAFINKPQGGSFRIEDAQVYGTEAELVVFVLSLDHRHIFSGAGVVQMYGWPIGQIASGAPKHLYMRGPHRGIFNLPALTASKDIILCEAFERGPDRAGALALEALGTRQQSASHATAVASECSHAAGGAGAAVEVIERSNCMDDGITARVQTAVRCQFLATSIGRESTLLQGQGAPSFTSAAR